MQLFKVFGERPVEFGRLVRILAVAEGRRGRQVAGKPGHLPSPVAQESGDGPVVARGRSEDLDREPGPQLGRGCPAIRGHLIPHRGVVGRVADDRDGGVVLGRAAEHRRTADVDVLNRRLERDARAGDRLLERVEIDHHEVDRRDPVRGRLFDVGWVVAAEKEAAVHERVERLDATVEHLGEARVLGNILHLQPRAAQRRCGSAGREKLDAVRG